MQTDSNVQKKFGQITVDSVTAHTMNEKKANAGILNAQLRQTVTSIYPTMNIKSGGLFEPNAFGDAVAGQSYESTRVTWLDVPAGTSVETLQQLLNASPSARIVAVYGNKVEDVLLPNEKAAIAAGLQTLEFFEEKRRIRAKDGSELPGERQYSNFFFDKAGRADIDLRQVKTSNTQVAQKEEVTATGAQNAL